MTDKQVSSQDLYNEWAQGVALANPPQDEYFQSVPMDLDKPADFVVDPNQIPDNPVSQPAPEPAPPVVEPQDEAPETLEIEGGGTLTLEKTNKGWHARLDSGEPNINPEDFYGASLKKLALNMAKGKLAATKAILKLKKEKLLGGDEPSKPVNIPSKPATTSVHVSDLTADDIVAIKEKWNEDRPDEAFGIWLKKQFGLDPNQFAEKLNKVDEANKIVEAQRIQAEVSEINQEFVRNNPDWSEDYGNVAANLRRLIGRMSKAYMNKKITEKTPQAVVDTTVYELYSAGFWTVENLENAKEELIESGLLEKSATQRAPSQPQPQPAAPVVSPSGPEQPIAGKAGQNAGANFGIPVRGTSTPVQPDTTPPSDVDLYSMPLDQLRRLAQAQMALNR